MTIKACKFRAQVIFNLLTGHAPPRIKKPEFKNLILLLCTTRSQGVYITKITMLGGILRNLQQSQNCLTFFYTPCSVKVHQAYRKYLTFFYRRKLYKYLALPNGLSTCPQKFTKLMKPPLAKLLKADATYHQWGTLMIFIYRAKLIQDV